MLDSLSEKVKQLRTKLGITQEQLADDSGLSLRTVQRIENQETVPRGDSLKKLAEALKTTSSSLSGGSENNSIPIALNASALLFLLFPLLGILAPFLFWMTKKGSSFKVDSVAKTVLNFQITWVLLAGLAYLSFIGQMLVSFNVEQNLSPDMVSRPMTLLTVVFIILYGFNLTSILVNTYRLMNNKAIKYFLILRFLK